MTAAEENVPTPAVLPQEATAAPKAGGKRGPKPKAVIEAETAERVRAEMEANFAQERAALQQRLAEAEAASTAPVAPVGASMEELVAKAVAEAVAALPQAAADPLAPGAPAVEAEDPETAQWTTKTPKQISADDLSDSEGDGSIVAHFLEDGFTFLSKVWYRGEEVVVTPGTMNWDLAQLNDGTGRLVLQMTEDEQYTRYDRQEFRLGRWRGRNLDLNDPNLTPEERERLVQAANKRAIRASIPSR